VAAYLSDIGVEVFGWRGMDEESYFKMLSNVAVVKPELVVDDGGDLHSLLHTKFLDSASKVGEGRLRYPVIAVNDTPTKRIVDNMFGTGQSTVDGFLRATSLLVAGKTVVVAGYGYVGRGVAARFRGLGARVIVTEVDPVKALEARLAGYEVMRMDRAAAIGDIFITCTGMRDVIRWEHIERMKNGAAVRTEEVRPYVEKYVFRDGRYIYLVGEGRLVNLVAAEGHPPDVMMASFSNQMLSLAYLVEKGDDLEKRVYNVPSEVDRRVAETILRGWGVEIDVLTEEQKKYWESWRV